MWCKYFNKINKYTRMWINRKSNTQQLIPSENIEPQYQQHLMCKLNNIDNNSLIQQLQKIAYSITIYQPLSNFVSVDYLKSSSNVHLKKFRESVFYGEIVQGKRTGKGIMIYVNGRVYEGEWLENFKHGKGFQKFSNGSTYKGDYARGKPEGCGRYQWENGQLYQGEWLNGLKHGSGIWRGAKGDSYIGQWRQGKADGYGVHTWTNGDRYQGEFKECLKHGEGVQRFANGDSYKGNYQNGKPCGYGEYFWSTGSFFKGQFKDGLRCGQGVWKKGPGRSEKYEGGWQRDKKQDYGVFTWTDGTVYKGNFVNDLKEGEGQIFYNDGTTLKAIWKLDQPIEKEECSLEHDEDCQLFVPSNGKAFVLNQHVIDTRQPQYIEAIPQPPTYSQFLRQPINRSNSKHIRQRNFTRQTARSEIRMRGESQAGKRNNVGLTKKMSVGSVAGRSEFKKTGGQNSMSSSFFLYKIHGGENTNRRQSRTSGGSRGNKSQIDEQLKYFARSKIGSYSQLQ